MPIAAAIRTHRRRAGSAGRSSAALRRLSRLPETVITQNAGNPVTNTWSYNRRRLPTAETQTPDGTRSWSLTYGYNPLGQRTSETAPDNVTTTYTVNALGQTTQISVKVKNATTTVASSASYYPNGALQQFTYGNGITHTLTQNARQLPQHSQDGSVLDLTTTFDANGNVAAIVDGTANARQSRSMTYDGLDRLTQVQSPMFGTASYGYDEQDNLRHVGISGGSQPRDHTYCYSADNRLEFVRSGPNCTGTASPAVIALGYDPQGNLQYKNGTAYSFDYGNRLRNTANQSYRYDAAGRRVRTDSAGSQLQYSDYASDGRLVWQRDEAVGKRINNIYLAGSLVAEVSRSLTTDVATYRYVHTDALGSPIAKTSSTGAILETSEYEPYGQLLNRANDDRAVYTGHVMDAGSGLIYMQARYYDPGIGGFLSVDPVSATSVGGNFNRYWYANNNPYLFTDPDGRIVKIAGSDKDVANFMSEASEITGLELTNTDGIISYRGDPSNAAAKIFIDAITATEIIQVNAVSNDPSIQLDQFSSNKVDVADLAGFSAVAPELGQAMLVHVLSERLHAARTGDDETASHRVAIRAESEVIGAARRTVGGLVPTPQGIGIRTGWPLQWQYRDASDAIIKIFQVTPNADGSLR